MDDTHSGQTGSGPESSSDPALGGEGAADGQNRPESNQAGGPVLGSEATLKGLVESTRSLGEEQLALAKLSHAVLGKIFEAMERNSEQSVVRLQRGFFLELAMLYDSLQEAMTWVRATTVPTQEAVLDRLNTLQIELLEILARRDVRVFDEKPTVLDRRLCRTVKTIPTAEPSEDNAVAITLRDGFLWRDDVLRPQDVAIKKYRAETAAKGE